MKSNSPYGRIHVVLHSIGCLVVCGSVCCCCVSCVVIVCFSLDLLCSSGVCGVVVVVFGVCVVFVWVFLVVILVVLVFSNKNKTMQNSTNT